MGRAFRASGVLALTAMLASAASPAMADGGWYGGGHGGWGHHHHRYRGHDDGFGVFLGAAAVIGAVAVLAASANKAKAESAPNDALPPEDEPYDERAGPGGPETTSPDRDKVATSSEDAAVDACASAAEDEASQGDDNAEVNDITGTQPIDGGWTVRGTINERGESRTRSFSCTWRDGRVADLVLDRDDVARL